jgi:hypothetical protein
MPQSIGINNTVDAVIELSVDGTSFTNVSGSSNKVEVSPQTADSGSVATHEGQYKAVRGGKYNPVEITVTGVYTEIAAELYAILHGQKNVPGRPLWVRWTPFGSNGEHRYVTADGLGAKAAGRIIEFPYPGTDAGDATPTMVVFKVQATQVLREAATPSPSASLSPSASASS